MPANSSGNIFILPPGEARRIAAGEVIERPAALVREFLDNAIDAKAANIDVYIEGGGCKKAEVSDDGEGMLREDLELCWHTHATSKIRTLNDLDTSLTLGFRGEALAAAAAVSRLEIITSTDGRQAWRLETDPGIIHRNNELGVYRGKSHLPKPELTRRTRGTTVRSLNLFESIPARKKFLKREGSEAGLCRQVFIDKALAFNKLNFRFYNDGKLKEFLPGVPSKKERFAAALLQANEKDFLHEINVTGSGFSAVIVIGGPELYRNDRRQLFVFANGRRVQDFALIQAMEYGTQGWFPNGAHPVGAVFLEIDPCLADFNIHPAKREVRFRDPGAIHHAVSGGVKSFFHMKSVASAAQKSDTVKNEEFKFADNNSFTGKLPSVSYIREKFNEINFAAEKPAPAYSDFRYAGRVFGLFILIEHNDKLYIIDQHAAHERILYDKFIEHGIPKQDLLVPIPFRTESDEEDSFLEEKREELSRLGIKVERDANLGWRIEALPADWRMGDAATVKEILELKTAGENMAQRWAASCCCHAAIKDGDYPDNETAFNLGKEALLLPEPRCPHGRPIWTEISRDALHKAVRRS
ncbi:MAG: DNA mismatch repair endonuclease MutL [Treponema sp.]|nr:DNA mismatch repair endonuclease MutL [Treponema sp.]